MDRAEAHDCGYTAGYTRPDRSAADAFQAYFGNTVQSEETHYAFSCGHHAGRVDAQAEAIQIAERYFERDYILGRD